MGEFRFHPYPCNKAPKIPMLSIGRFSPRPPPFRFCLHQGFQRRLHFFIEHEQMFDALAFGCEAFRTIEPVHGTVDGLVRPA